LRTSGAVQNSLLIARLINGRAGNGPAAGSDPHQ
jgi:hypothetical protein